MAHKIKLLHFKILEINYKNIILINKDHSISKVPLNYSNIGLNIWKPIPPKGYRALNKIISINKPSIEDGITVNKNLVSKSNMSDRYYILDKNKIFKFMSNKKHTDTNL